MLPKLRHQMIPLVDATAAAAAGKIGSPVALEWIAVVAVVAVATDTVAGC